MSTFKPKQPGNGADEMIARVARPRVHLLMDASGSPIPNPNYPATSRERYSRDKSPVLAMQSMLADAHAAAKKELSRTLGSEDVESYPLAVVAMLVVIPSTGTQSLPDAFYYAYGQDKLASFARLRGVAESRLRMTTPLKGVETVRSASGSATGRISVIVGDVASNPFTMREDYRLHQITTRAAALAFRSSPNDPHR